MRGEGASDQAALSRVARLRENCVMIDSFHRARVIGAIVAIALAAVSGPGAAEERRPLRIFAAASLSAALTDALKGWNGETLVVHAGSSTLARQIEQGAQADVFLSADRDWVEYLAAAGLTEGEPVDLIGNRLVAVAPRDAPEAEVPPFPAGSVLAVAEVDSVPAGRYARRALEAAGDWPTKARLLQAAHVREALAWAARGEADYAIVYASDAASEARVRLVAVFPGDPERPIRYVGVAIAGADPEAQALLRRLAEPEAQAAFARYGFLPLEDKDSHGRP